MTQDDKGGGLEWSKKIWYDLWTAPNCCLFVVFVSSRLVVVLVFSWFVVFCCLPPSIIVFVPISSFVVFCLFCWELGGRVGFGEVTAPPLCLTPHRAQVGAPAQYSQHVESCHLVLPWEYFGFGKVYWVIGKIGKLGYFVEGGLRENFWRGREYWWFGIFFYLKHLSLS